MKVEPIVFASFVPVDGVWHHISFVKNDLGERVYVDGVKVPTA